MPNLLKRRVYIMDCGDFIKIGVSYNVEQRKNQIPYRIKQYYCTEFIDNALELEKFMHKVYSPLKNENGTGREYFNADFNCACKVLKAAVSSERSRRKQVESVIAKLKVKENKKFDNDFYEFICMVLKCEIPDLTFLLYVINGLKARSLLRDKENADNSKNKELQEV